LSNLARVLK